MVTNKILSHPQAVSSHFDIKDATILRTLFQRQLGMCLFLAAEAMMFAGLISAYIVLSQTAGEWPPLDQPRLPILFSALNMMILIFSGCCIAISAGQAKCKDKRPLVWLIVGLTSGIIFVGFQGLEWMQLINYGLSVTNNTFAGTFYVIIGTHALHVFGGIVALASTLYLAFSAGITSSQFQASFMTTRLYWYFVVAVWPILYAVVYL
jgi:heme/copper-type cytochrome/quinol oxidase subunit 3